MWDQVSISLPPSVEGPIHGELRLRVRPSQSLPLPLSIQVFWWGDSTGSLLSGEEETFFPISTSLLHFLSYLRDAHSLTFNLFSVSKRKRRNRQAGKVDTTPANQEMEEIGTCVVELNVEPFEDSQARLDIFGTFAVTSKSGREIGSLEIEMNALFGNESSLLRLLNSDTTASEDIGEREKDATSFLMNEVLASVPSPVNVQQQQQQQQQQGYYQQGQQVDMTGQKREEEREEARERAKLLIKSLREASKKKEKEKEKENKQRIQRHVEKSSSPPQQHVKPRYGPKRLDPNALTGMDGERTDKVKLLESIVHRANKLRKDLDGALERSVDSSSVSYYSDDPAQLDVSREKVVESDVFLPRLTSEDDEQSFGPILSVVVRVSDLLIRSSFLAKYTNGLFIQAFIKVPAALSSSGPVVTSQAHMEKMLETQVPLALTPSKPFGERKMPWKQQNSQASSSLVQTSPWREVSLLTESHWPVAILQPTLDQWQRSSLVVRLSSLSPLGSHVVVASGSLPLKHVLVSDDLSLSATVQLFSIEMLHAQRTNHADAKVDVHIALQQSVPERRTFFQTARANMNKATSVTSPVTSDNTFPVDVEPRSSLTDGSYVSAQICDVHPAGLNVVVKHRIGPEEAVDLPRVGRKQYKWHPTGAAILFEVYDADDSTLLGLTRFPEGARLPFQGWLKVRDPISGIVRLKLFVWMTQVTAQEDQRSDRQSGEQQLITQDNEGKTDPKEEKDERIEPKETSQEAQSEHDILKTQEGNMPPRKAETPLLQRGEEEKEGAESSAEAEEARAFSTDDSMESGEQEEEEEEEADNKQSVNTDHHVFTIEILNRCYRSDVPGMLVQYVFPVVPSRRSAASLHRHELWWDSASSKSNTLGRHLVETDADEPQSILNYLPAAYGTLAFRIVGPERASSQAVPKKDTDKVVLDAVAEIAGFELIELVESARPVNSPPSTCDLSSSEGHLFEPVAQASKVFRTAVVRKGVAKSRRQTRRIEFLQVCIKYSRYQLASDPASRLHQQQNQGQQKANEQEKVVSDVSLARVSSKQLHPAWAKVCFQVGQVSGLRSLARVAAQVHPEKPFLYLAAAVGPNPSLSIQVQLQEKSGFVDFFTQTHARTFSPTFNEEVQAVVQLDSHVLEALGKANATVKLWHTQHAVVFSPEQQGLEESEQVLLGEAELPLRDLLLSSNGVQDQVKIFAPGVPREDQQPALANVAVFFQHHRELAQLFPLSQANSSARQDYTDKVDYAENTTVQQPSSNLRDNEHTGQEEAVSIQSVEHAEKESDFGSIEEVEEEAEQVGDELEQDVIVMDRDPFVPSSPASLHAEEGNWVGLESTTAPVDTDEVQFSVKIENALHLPMILRNDSLEPPAAYVTYKVDRAHLSETCYSPVASNSPSCNPVWDHSKTFWFPAKGPKLLRLHIWHRACWRGDKTVNDQEPQVEEYHLEASGLPGVNYDPYESETLTSRVRRDATPVFSSLDAYIGTAVVDLSTLFLGIEQIHGWYHVVDDEQRRMGQVKVLVRLALQATRESPNEGQHHTLQTQETQETELHPHHDDGGEKKANLSDKSRGDEREEEEEEEGGQDLAILSALESLEHVERQLKSRLEALSTSDAPQQGSEGEWRDTSFEGMQTELDLQHKSKDPDVDGGEQSNEQSNRQEDEDARGEEGSGNFAGKEPEKVESSECQAEANASASSECRTEVNVDESREDESSEQHVVKLEQGRDPHCGEDLKTVQIQDGQGEHEQEVADVVREDLKTVQIQDGQGEHEQEVADVVREVIGEVLGMTQQQGREQGEFEKEEDEDELVEVEEEVVGIDELIKRDAEQGEATASDPTHLTLNCSTDLLEERTQDDETVPQSEQALASPQIGSEASFAELGILSDVLDAMEDVGPSLSDESQSCGSDDNEASVNPFSCESKSPAPFLSASLPSTFYNQLSQDPRTTAATAALPSLHVCTTTTPNKKKTWMDPETARIAKILRG